MIFGISHAKIVVIIPVKVQAEAIDAGNAAGPF